MISIKIIYSIIYWMFPQCILILNCEHISLFLLTIKKIGAESLAKERDLFSSEGFYVFVSVACLYFKTLFYCVDNAGLKLTILLLWLCCVRDFS